MTDVRCFEAGQQSVNTYQRFQSDLNVEAKKYVESKILDSNSSNETKNEDQLIKIEDPLSEPIVRLSLDRVKISTSQLIDMSVKELNKRLSNCPAYIITKLKRCRRILKNRGYAKNCRIKRIAAKNHLEQVNMKLMIEIKELRQHNKSLIEELNQLRANQVVSNAKSTGATTINGNDNLPCSGIQMATFEPHIDYVASNDYDQNYQNKPDGSFSRNDYEFEYLPVSDSSSSPMVWPASACMNQLIN